MKNFITECRANVSRVHASLIKRHMKEKPVLQHLYDIRKLKKNMIEDLTEVVVYINIDICA